MGFNTAALEVGATAIRAAITHVQIHTGAPGGSGTTNVSSAARQPVTWVDNNNGDVESTATIAFTGGAANGAAAYLTFWSASSSGTYYGDVSLGAATFNAEGELNITSITGDGASTG